MNNFEAKITDGVWYLYVIKCEHGYHYVGVTKDVKKRYQQHSSGNGADITKFHKPIKITQVFIIGDMSYVEAEKYENAFTLSMMAKYGDRWRGGRYCQGCKSSAVKRNLKQIEDKYKKPLDCIYSDFERKKRKKKRRAKGTISPEMKLQISKAEEANRKAIKRRFGVIY